MMTSVQRGPTEIRSVRQKHDWSKAAITAPPTTVCRSSSFWYGCCFMQWLYFLVFVCHLLVVFKKIVFIMIFRMILMIGFAHSIHRLPQMIFIVSTSTIVSHVCFVFVSVHPSQRRSRRVMLWSEVWCHVIVTVEHTSCCDRQDTTNDM